jgi:hypothetical protein
MVIATAIAGIAAVSCIEPPLGQTPVDSVPPQAASNVNVEPMPGGALVTYDLSSSDKDISYVKCEYEYKGEKWTVRSSIYDNYLIIEGLGSVEPVDFTLYVVDHSENVSEGVTKTFTPNVPPLETIFASVEMTPIFGGVSIMWTNETETEIGVTVFAEDSTGVMREGRTQYSRETYGELSFRGYDPVECKFAVRITDKWGNVSGVKEGVVIPLYERLLDKSKFFALELPGDHTGVSGGRPLSNCWDGRDDVIWHTSDGEFMPFPFYFTIDLGTTVKFSRMRLRPRTDYYYYTHTFKTFEVWGAKNYKRNMPITYWVDSEHGGNEEWKTDGDWEMLGDYEVKRPSGATEAIAKPTGEDLAYAQAGFPFDVPIEKETLRYLRFVIKSTWASGAMYMAEFYFYGDDGVYTID